MDLIELLIFGWMGFKGYQKGHENGQKDMLQQLKNHQQDIEIKNLRQELEAIKRSNLTSKF